MKTKLNNFKFIIAAFIAFIAIPFSAIAQIALDEIVVTARKRSESLLEIPESIAKLVWAKPGCTLY